MNGKGKINKILIQVYEENNKLMRQEEGSKYIQSTVDKYFISIERLKKFIQQEYGVQDIQLDRLNYQFIQHYEIFLRTKYANHHNTNPKNVQCLLYPWQRKL